jgi:hypothetical protein
VIGEEASLDEASRPELAVIKRFALATSLRIEEIVTLSWLQVDWENREVRLMQKGRHYRTIPLTAETLPVFLEEGPAGVTAARWRGAPPFVARQPLSMSGKWSLGAVMITRHSRPSIRSSRPIAVRLRDLLVDETAEDGRRCVDHHIAALLAIRNPACPPEERGSSMLSRLPLCSRRILLRARASRPKYVDRSRTLTTA